MIRLSKNQCAIINAAVKPFSVTTNYLSERFKKVIEYHAKYYSRCRFTIYKYKPVHRNQYHLTLEYNHFWKRFGYARPERPTIQRFYGVPLQTIHGRNVHAKKLKWSRKRLRKRKKKAQLEKQKQQINNADTESLSQMVDLSAGLKNAKKTAIIKSNIPADRSWNTNNTTANIFNGTITNDCRSNSSFADALDEQASSSDKFHSMEEDPRTSAVSESTHNTSIMSGTSNNINSEMNGDINQKLRQQLKLLKTRKSDFTLTSSKESTLSLSTRPVKLSWRQSDSNQPKAKTTTEPLATIAMISTKQPIDQSTQHLKTNHAKRQVELKEMTQSSKPVSGMIDSLFNKLKSINQSDTDGNNTQSRLGHSSTKTSSPTQTATSTPLRRTRRDDSSNKTSILSDSNPEDSNQSTASMSLEFHGFDISNKNVDVSALLPTPKAPTTNSQSAFISEDLDMFLKENYLENVADILIVPKSFNADEALMTKDAQPPSLAVPARPLDMQRPRTLAEKRMILQQHNDVSIMIIENESTVYHELKKRVKFGTSYDNSLMQRIQDVNVPFTRDCWRAACWAATSNNRFLYRTIVIDGEEIKLIGSRGNNIKKVSFEVKTQDARRINVSKYLPPDCSRICLPIENIKITNIDDIIAKIKLRNDNMPSLKCGSIFGNLKNAKLNMFSREYLAPGPKCKKAKCKWNRSTSFDLEYGPLELLYLPTVQLELWPQIGVPLPEHIKPLLKNILPESNVITPEWAKFAVSVVKEPAAKPQLKHRRKYKKPEPKLPQSFVFDIPYENSEKKILIRRRRRSSIVFDKNDAKNEKIESFYLDKMTNGLTFLDEIDATDYVAVQCADILSNMIESVAISVNERNFTKLDPDIDYVGKVVTISQQNKENSKTVVKTEKEKQTSKTENAAKMKLMKELKRLNVTVIDTADEATKNKSSEQCTKPFCRHGCVCESIEAKKYIPSHCNRVECIFDCKCIDFKRSNYFGFDRDIDLLHAQANARLAKVEKEFKSTIVVSENDTFVLPNTSTATKRSSKKPKRFTSDESCFDDPETELFWKSKRRRQERNEIERCKIDEQQRVNLVRSAQHVRVVAEPLPDMDVEPWCMFHCLYKCHCKGKSQKGRAFNFANKKNDMPSHTLGGWEIISPRKRQYTFERELGQNGQTHELSMKIRKNALDPPIKARKTYEPVLQPAFQGSSDAPTVYLESAARTRAFNCLRIRRKTAQELKTLRNTCMFDEKRYSNLLREKIQICRNYNKTQNMLTKTMESGIFTRPLQTDQESENLSQSDELVSSTSSLTPSVSSVRQLNDVISDTMQRLTCNQRQDKLILRKSINKLSIVCWDRVVEAFKTRELFVWDVTLITNNRALLLTDNFMKPQNSRFTSATNINYIDSDHLPMMAKLLRMHVCNEQTKYLAVLLLRLSDFWRILGVVHSDLNYMDDELIAKPTPEKNPLLSKKINTLFHLLTHPPKESIDSLDAIALNKNNEETSENTEVVKDKNPTSSENLDLTPPDPSLIDDSPSKLSEFECNDIVRKVRNATYSHRNVNYFENASLRLSLPIPIERTQRLLRVHIGDDFSHMWFSKWRKFLSLKQIQNTITMAKASGKAIEMSQSLNRPKVFVSHLHDNQIFMGPYESTDVQQNVSLFIRNEEGRMEMAEEYHKRHGRKYNKKTKVQWVYPHSRFNGENTTDSQIMNANQMHLKIDQVFSKLDLPPDFAVLESMGNSSTDKAGNHEYLIDANDIMPSASNDSSSKQCEWMNGSKKRTVSSTSTTSSKSSDMNIACYRTVDNGDAQKEKLFTVPKIRLIKTNLIRTDNKEPKGPIDLKERKQLKDVKAPSSNVLEPEREPKPEPLQLKIASVASGEGVALMTNGFPADLIPNSDNSNDSNSKDTDLLIPKTEPIDITDVDTDDEHYVEEEPTIPMVAPIVLPSKQKESKGYIYCSTNISLGKIFIQKTSPTTIRLNLHSPLEIDCEDTTWQRCMPAISSSMQSYIRKRFYAVYPAYLRLDWVFINDDRDPCELNDFIELDDFNKLNKHSVIFKDKIVSIQSKYTENQSLTKTEIYVLDIFKLASQLINDEEVKLLNISDILKKARVIDQQLATKVLKLNNSKRHFEREIEKLTNKLNRNKHNSIQNGENTRSNNEQSVDFNREQ